MKLLFVVHNWVGYAPHGGTEVHVQSIVDSIVESSEHQIYILFPELIIAGNCSNYLLLNPIDKVFTKINLSYPVTPECYRHEELSNQFASILVKYQIDIVHFFHLIKYPLNLPLVAQIAGAKVVVSFFDYYFVCQQFNLLKTNNYYCGYPNVSTKTCDLCLKQTFGYQAGTQTRRRNLISEVLYHANAIHYLCNDQQTRIIAAYPYLKNKYSLTIGLGLDAKPQNYNQFNNYSLPLKIACIGNFDVNKGAELILQVIDYYQSINQQKIEFYIYGDVRHPYSIVLREMAKYENVKIYGSYTPKELPALLQECHVALFASIWPETFVLALSEIWSCGLIPVAPKLGAFGERIINQKNGFLYNYQDPGSLITVLDNLLMFNKQNFLRLLESINQVEYPSLQTNISKYLSLYEQIHHESIDIKSLELLSRLVADAHPEVWQKVHSPLFLSSTITSSKKALLRKAWQFYKREGFGSTVNRLAKYAKSKLNITK